MRAQRASPARELALHREAARPRHSTRALLVVTVVNGDTDRRVRGARVRIGHNADRADVHGVALIRVQRRAPYNVTINARGYAARTLREPFQRRRKVTMRIYRPALQWPMYGVSARRSQAQSQIRVRPPFRLVWSLGIGSMIEFPAVVSDGVAYIGNLHGTVRAISMRSGKLVWRHDTPHGKMAASPAVWRDELIVRGMDGHVWVLGKHPGRLPWDRTIRCPVASSAGRLRGGGCFCSW